MTPDTEVALAAWSTLGVGGPARWFWRAANGESLRQALAWARDCGAAVHVLGGGSNVVFADEGFDGLVIQVDIRCLEFRDAPGGAIRVRAGAGEPWDPLVALTVDRGLAGLECLSGIPGLVGGTPVQNVGAYGQDVSATIAAIEVIDRASFEAQTMTNEDCGFGYRTSRFKHADRDRFVVTHVEFALMPGPPTLAYADLQRYFAARETPPSLAEVRAAVLAIRRAKGMVIEPGNPANRSVGSFFVNPVIARAHADDLARRFPEMPRYPAGADRVKVPAAWLIEHAGFPRGTRRGPVGVSPLQAQAIVNLEAARAADVLSLAAAIKTAVRRAFAVALVPEPVFVGFRPSRELHDLFDPGSRIE
jgi:UDP-N-acetylmuramate dehydrogenase